MPLPRPRLTQRAQRVTAALIVRIAQGLIGRWTYIFGGGIPPGRLGGDCSLFVSYVLHRAGLAIPGGPWGGPGQPPAEHGPVVTDYVDWAGATTIPLPEAGCLCCWDGVGADGHIGIAISPTDMVSALNPADGVMRTPIQGTGPQGVPLVYRRVNGIAGGGIIPPVPGQAAPSKPPLVVAAIVALVYVGAAVTAMAATAALAVVGGQAVRKARA